MNLVYGRDEIVGRFVAHGLRVPEPDYFSPYVAIGIERDGAFRCGVVYNNFRKSPWGEPVSIEMSVYAIDKFCWSSHILRHLFSYPFLQLRVQRVQATIAKPNMVARRFVERLGFTLEGIGRKAHHNGKDAAIYSLLKEECGWILEQKHSKRTRST